MKGVKFLLGLAAAVVLAGCASPIEKAYEGSSRYPMNQRPAYYKQLLANGSVSQKQYDELMLTWEQSNAELARERQITSSMTTAERAMYWQQQDIITNQERQIAMQQYDQRMRAIDRSTEAVRSTGQSMQNTGNTQTVVNAINSR